MEHHRGGRPRHPDILTPAEWRVLEELRRGGTNAEIAARLGIGAETVKSHVSSMLAKLELRSREELAAWRPDERRSRLRALFALPAVLGSFARPLMWVGAGAAVLAGVAAVVVALVVLEVALEGNGDPPVVSGPAASPGPLRARRLPPRSGSHRPLRWRHRRRPHPRPTSTPSPAPSPTATLRRHHAGSLHSRPPRHPYPAVAPRQQTLTASSPSMKGRRTTTTQVTVIPADKLLGPDLGRALPRGARASSTRW